MNLYLITVASFYKGVTFSAFIKEASMSAAAKRFYYKHPKYSGVPVVSIIVAERPVDLGLWSESPEKAKTNKPTE